MHIKIISPQKLIYSSNIVKEAFIPTTTGIIGILPKHENLISILKIGEVRIRNESATQEEIILINGGILEIKDDEIILLAQDATLPKELIIEEIDKAIKMVEEKKASLNVQSSELIQLEKELLYHRFKQKYVDI